MQQGGRISFLKILYIKKRRKKKKKINLDIPSAYLEFRQVLILFIFFFIKICFFFINYTTPTTSNIHTMKTKNNRVINSILFIKKYITKSTAGWTAAVN